MQAVSGVLQLVLERITARIAVSDAGPPGAGRAPRRRRLGDPQRRVAWPGSPTPQPLPGWPGEGGAIGFLGRFTEPRKGFAVLLEAFTRLARQRPGLRLLVAGPGDPDEALEDVPADVAARITFLGMVSEEDKARMLRSVDVYVAPNTGGESFGMILTEAMAAGTPVVASDLDAFRRVLDGGRAGALFPVGDAAALAARAGPAARPTRRSGPSCVPGPARSCRAYDWPVVAQRVLEVYTFAIEASPRGHARRAACRRRARPSADGRLRSVAGRCADRSAGLTARARSSGYDA